MNVKDITNRYGNMSKASKVLGYSKECISNWRDNKKIPNSTQLKIECMTRGKLKADFKRSTHPADDIIISTYGSIDNACKKMDVSVKKICRWIGSNEIPSLYWQFFPKYFKSK